MFGGNDSGVINKTVKVSLNSLVHNAQEKMQHNKKKQGEEEYEDECAIGTFNFTDLDNKKSTMLGKYDPQLENMVVIPGLNFKGKCKNNNCLSNTNKTYQTWIRKGFGKFDMAQDRFDNKCSGCGNVVDDETILTFGITRCIANIIGRKKMENGTEKVDLKVEQREGKFIEFDDADEKIKAWISLKIQVKPI